MRSPLARRTLGPFFLFAGLTHFARTVWYEAIVPDYLPASRALVLASGSAEMLGGAAAILARRRWIPRWWLTATLVAVFPANVHMAVNPERYSRIPRWALYLRLPVQAAFVVWVWRGTRPAG